jgi:hypothetical protein
MIKKYLIIASLATLLIIFPSSLIYAQNDIKNKDIIEKVKQKVEDLKKNPRAVIGTVTDKTDVSLQIKTNFGKVEVVSISDTTSYIKAGKTDTQIKYSDIAIGDFVISLSRLENSQTLMARRIILTNAPENSRNVAVGKVVKKFKRQITIQQGEKEEVFTFPTKWKGPEIEEIAEGDTVVIVGILTNTEKRIRTIEILKGTPTKESKDGQNN